MRLGKLADVLNIGPEQADNVHGTHDKSLIVLHETVSPDISGWADVKSISSYLDNKDYGIHGIVDSEGHVAWAYGLGKAIFYHAASSGSRGNGLVNTRGIGIELVSKVMLQSSNMLERWRIWWARTKQLHATAKLVAWVSRVHDIPLVDSDSSVRGVTTHWEVTQRWGVSGGHTDCWPKHRGGYFPKLRIIRLAKYYRALGY
jgi:N-acetyl-anhydromuramyl-L-alanine amidase AmpD